jgi:CheY-like chemotaxis protein
MVGKGTMNKRVVIIDHDKEFLGGLEELLVTIGHEPVVVNDALSAVDVIVQREPDVIFLELKMPHKNGFELADEINRKLETRKIPIIAMSKFFKEEFRFLMDLCGIRGHLKKPVNPLDIISVIDNVTENSGQSRNIFNNYELRGMKEI